MGHDQSRRMGHEQPDHDPATLRRVRAKEFERVVVARTGEPPQVVGEYRVDGRPWRARRVFGAWHGFSGEE
jgi:hypothetical protein